MVASYLFIFQMYSQIVSYILGVYGHSLFIFYYLFSWNEIFIIFLAVLLILINESWQLPAHVNTSQVCSGVVIDGLAEGNQP